jgi:hypothetical protein
MRVYVAALLLAWAHSVAAQAAPADNPRRVPVAPVLELRAVVPIQEEPEFQVGAGLSLRAGWYVRGAIALLGGAVQDDSATRGVARVEAAVRFHLDPFFEAPGCGRGETDRVCRGVYAGVGLSQRFVENAADDPGLLLLVGIEGRRTSAGVWALELGVGGGVRVGATWRRSRADGYR